MSAVQAFADWPLVRGWPHPWTRIYAVIAAASLAVATAQTEQLWLTDRPFFAYWMIALVGFATILAGRAWGPFIVLALWLVFWPDDRRLFAVLFRPGAGAGVVVQEQALFLALLLVYVLSHFRLALLLDHLGISPRPRRGGEKTAHAARAGKRTQAAAPDSAKGATAPAAGPTSRVARRFSPLELVSFGLALLGALVVGAVAESSMAAFASGSWSLLTGMDVPELFDNARGLALLWSLGLILLTGWFLAATVRRYRMTRWQAEVYLHDQLLTELRRESARIARRLQRLR